jgi:hypothetical protein
VPVPDPDVALNVVEPGLVPQTNPLELTAAPPSEEIVPPDVAVVPAIEDTAVVVSVGAANVVKLSSFP